MTNPDFDHMTKDEILAWFRSNEDLSPLLARTTATTEAVAPSRSGEPMMLASIRLPVSMVDQLDSIADLDGLKRSEVIRAALLAYITERNAPVERDEAERALAVLHRALSTRTRPHTEAA